MRKTGLSLLVLAATGLLSTALIVAWTEHYRVDKIDFIVWDNQHDNVANLDQRQLADYLQHCGARIHLASTTWTVAYDGIFQHRNWRFAFVEPATHASP